MKIGECELDKAGRIVIPKQVRKHCHMEVGEKLELFIEGSRLVIQSALSDVGLQVKNGLLVYKGEGNFSADVEVEKLREERIHSFVSTNRITNKTEKKKNRSGRSK
jgi:AbrB family looped-hinge helix DNA binding protein